MVHAPNRPPPGAPPVHINLYSDTQTRPTPAMKDAMMLLLTGKRISAKEALRISLINEVVPQSELMTAAVALAKEILACAPLAVQASKQVMLQSLSTPDLKKAMKARYEAAEHMLKSQDAVEGPLAFAEKRKPVWLGR